jgi:hypothetical protein
MERTAQMGYFDITTSVIPLPSDPRNAGIEPREGLAEADVPGYWVKIKDELDFGDINYRTKQVVRLETKGVANLDQASARWELEQFSLATLERAIIEWNLDQGSGKQGVILPVKADNIRLLKNSDATFILGFVMKRNPTDGDPEGKVSDSDSTTKPSMDDPASSRMSPG